ncbi:Zn-ribbon domain-containing OB-fold protein (plasmid) [Haladaptatus sp. SPP-AMP-3]|uniref:Zn-ribbon domain-containing OB-fold protein n=1 Tax=Haladaptatus sp. SPP-AMP-3 TaxID=3121295 RepID=UPI003C2D1863
MGAHISIPVYERTVGQRLAFEGERCTDCGTVAFPPKGACPDCRNDAFEAVDLSGEGTIYSYTVLSPGGAPPEFAGQAQAEGRYVVAIVELDEGPRITAQVTDVDPTEVAVGMSVSGRIRRIYEEEGIVRYGFKFVPATE